MDLWARLTGRNVAALEAEVSLLEREALDWQAQAEAWWAEYEALAAAVRDLQREVTEATDGWIEFLPRAVVTETVLERAHNKKQFHAVA